MKYTIFIQTTRYTLRDQNDYLLVKKEINIKVLCIIIFLTNIVHNFLEIDGMSVHI